MQAGAQLQIRGVFQPFGLPLSTITVARRQLVMFSGS